MTNRSLPPIKTCVFCGQKPKDKTREHVIPLWLIELTGDPNRIASLGWDKKDPSSTNGFVGREFAFDQFVFPACRVCNERYSNLETAAKHVMNGILEGREIDAAESSLFLDWLDKVRVGLWLGFIQLDKNYAGVEPNFHIDTRIGQCDRLVVIEKTDMPLRRLNFSGVDCLSFAITPSAFVLTVNNYYFTNISYPFLLARRLGLPFASNEEIVPDGRTSVDMHEARQRVMQPVVRHPIRPGGVVLYQSMFRVGLVEPITDLYTIDYVRNHSLDFERGVGNVYVEDTHGLREIKGGESFFIQPTVVYEERLHRHQAAISVYQWQNWLGSLLASTKMLEKRHSQYVRQKWAVAKKINDALIAYCKSRLKQA